MPDYNKLNIKNDDGIVDDVPINDRVINTSKKNLKLEKSNKKNIFKYTLSL